jgi:hypothetical protein
VGRLRFTPSSQDPRTFAIIGAAYEVHRVLGAGFLELFYKEALAIEFTERRGTFGSRDWVHTSFGRKIQKAVDYRTSGSRLAIVGEDHWARCIDA